VKGVTERSANKIVGRLVKEEDRLVESKKKLLTPPEGGKRKERKETRLVNAYGTKE